jgi:type II secretory pathway pseudopilin PulG
MFSPSNSFNQRHHRHASRRAMTALELILVIAISSLAMGMAFSLVVKSAKSTRALDFRLEMANSSDALTEVLQREFDFRMPQSWPVVDLTKEEYVDDRVRFWSTRNTFQEESLKPPQLLEFALVNQSDDAKEPQFAIVQRTLEPNSLDVVSETSVVVFPPKSRVTLNFTYEVGPDREKTRRAPSNDRPIAIRISVKQAAPFDGLRSFSLEHIWVEETAP